MLFFAGKIASYLTPQKTRTLVSAVLNTVLKKWDTTLMADENRNTLVQSKIVSNFSLNMKLDSSERNTDLV